MSDSVNVFVDTVVLLGAATVAAPLFKKIGLGTVLGYLCAGIVLGPILHYVHDGEQLLHIAELGVVLLLFLVGLELKPALLWQMRREIFGLGALQVIASGILLAAIAWLAYFSVEAAIVVGFGLALSSTAFALQLLEDSGDDRSNYGKKSLSILLFQDLAIAPLLILVSILAAGSMTIDASSLSKIGVAIVCILVLFLAGRYALNPLFSIIASTGAREAMIAAALFIVIGAALLMQFAGMSMAMGAFIAGVMLAESSFRHELEADIEPFRGILLGLFFMAVGLAVDLSVVVEYWYLIIAAVAIAMLVKAAILYGISRRFGCSHNDSVKIASILPQHGEFGFVLFTAAMSATLLSSTETTFLISCVTLSMALTPLSMKLGQMFLSAETEEQMDEDYEGAGSEVLMIGFSRMGQIAAQALLAGGCDVTILDNNAQRIRQAKKFGFRIYYGDGKRLDVLRSAGIERTKIVAVCPGDKDTTDHIVDLVRDRFPNVSMYVRSYDRTHAIELRNKDVTWEIRETFESAMAMGRALLQGIGISVEESQIILDDVRRRDSERLKMQLQDGITAGRDHLHIKPVTPEPLLVPHREAEAVDDTTRRIVEE